MPTCHRCSLAVSPEAATDELAKHVNSRAEMEQYLDFLSDRSFRKSLLAKDVDALQRSIRPSGELLSSFSIRTGAYLEGTVQDPTQRRRLSGHRARA